MPGLESPGYLVELRLSQNGAFPPDRIGIQPNDAPYVDLAGPALPIPGAGSDVDILACPRAVVVVLGRQHEAQQPLTVPAHQKYGSVLTLRMVLFIGNPAPHNLTRVRVAIGLGGVADLNWTAEVAGVGAWLMYDVGSPGLRPSGTCRGGRLGGVASQRLEGPQDEFAQRAQVESHVTTLQLAPANARHAMYGEAPVHGRLEDQMRGVFPLAYAQWQELPREFRQ